MKVFPGNLAQEPYCQSWARKRVFHQNLFRQAQVLADAADLVLEKVAKGLDEGKRHVFRQAADVMVCLDSGGWRLHRDGLNDVRVECSLNEPSDFAVGISTLQFLGFLGEDRDEFPADDFSLLLRVRNANELVQKAV